MVVEVVGVGYAQGWDPAARVPWRPIPVTEARERDTEGLPYVVVYRTAGRAAPLEVRHVSWRDHYVGVWVYDARGRRVEQWDLRLLDDPARLLGSRRAAHITVPGVGEEDRWLDRPTSPR